MKSDTLCLEYSFAYNLKPLVSFYSLQMQENQRLKKKIVSDASLLSMQL
jgi:hypothetical protein